MRLALFLACLPLGATVTINSVRVNPTDIIIDFTRPDTNACTVEVSESASYSPVALPVDPAVFTNANTTASTDERIVWIDPSNSLHVVFHAGLYGVVELGLDGKYHSRALYANTNYYIRVCGTATTTATTAETLAGASFRPDFIKGADGYPLYPEFPDFCTRSVVIAEPFTGRRIKRYGTQCDSLRIFGAAPFQRMRNVTSGWTITGTTAATFTSSSCSVACPWLAVEFTNPTGITEEQESIQVSINYALLAFTGGCSGANTGGSDCPYETCLKWESDTCGGPVVSLTNAGTVSVCAKDGTTNCVVGDLLGADYRGTFHQGLGVGYIFTSGTSSTVQFTDAGDCAQRRVGEVFTASKATAVNNLTVATLSCPTITVTSPVNFDPGASGALGYPFHYNDGFQGNPRWGFLIRKKSLTANNTISVTNPTQTPTYGGAAGTTSAGYNEFQSQYTDSSGFRKARHTTKIYAVKQDTSGEVRFLGQFYGTGGGNGIVAGNQCTQVGDGSTFWTDANTFLAICPANADGTFRLWQIAFTGDTANDVEKLPAPGQNTSFVAGSTVTDLSGNLLTKVHAFDSTFDSAVYGNVGMCGLSGGRYVHFFIEAGSQDTLAWAAVYDTMTNTVIAAWETWASPSSTRWSVNHACFWFAPANNAPASANLAGMDLKRGRDDTNFGALYHLTITQAMTTSTTTVTVASTTPTTVGGLMPVTLQAVLAGDVFTCGGDLEAMQITAVNSTTSISFTRGFGGTSPQNFPSPPLDCWMTPYFAAGLPITNVNSGEFWNFGPESHGPANNHVYLNNCPGGGHWFGYSIWGAGSPPLAGNTIPAGIENSLGSFPLCDPASFSQTGGLPLLAGVAYGVNNSCLEGHPSFKPLAYPLVVDNHPNIGCGTQEDTSLTRVGGSGTLFKLAYNENPFGATPYADGYSVKYLPHLTTSQAKVFKDISGPGSVITGAIADASKRCRAQVANECVSGSSPGDVFLNSAYMDPGNWSRAFGVNCWLASTIIDDTCSADLSMRGETVMGYVLPTTATLTVDPNKSFPLLYNFGMVPKNSANTQNTKLFWNGWAFGGWLQYGASESYFVQVPTADPTVSGANNTVYVDTVIPVTSVPSMTDHVLIEQGYADYSTTPYTLPYSTQRRDKTVTGTGNSASNPFYYTVEGSGGTEATLPGIPCAVTCTVHVLTLPGETAYMNLNYYTAGNALISSVKLPMGGGGAPAPPVGTGSTVLSGRATISGSARQ